MSPSTRHVVTAIANGRATHTRIHTVYPYTLQPATPCTPRCSTPNPGHRQARRLHGFHCTGLRAFSRARSPKVFCFYFSNLPLTISNKLKRGHEILEFYESALQPYYIIRSTGRKRCITAKEPKIQLSPVDSLCVEYCFKYVLTLHCLIYAL